MGRRKLEIKRIQDKNCRQVAFCKRRQGLIKKANELSILCNVDVGVVIISKNGTGRLHEYSSTNSNIASCFCKSEALQPLMFMLWSPCFEEPWFRATCVVKMAEGTRFKLVDDRLLDMMKF
ncbi:putative RING-H2 finger protein ATL54-like [Capsicum annuum]|nr:putative RING-H2 finger protein ATL54-like [Capsicum annuum]